MRVSSRSDAATAFVLNVSFAGLGAIRSLGRAGVPVIGLDPNPNHPGFASRYCTAMQCPHPVYEPEALLDLLLREGKRLPRPGVLSPASDGFVLFVSRYRDELAPYFRFTLPSPEMMEAVVDKSKLYKLADRHGVPHADTRYPDSMDDVHRIKHDLDYPAFIKPYQSHIWEVTFPELGKGIKAWTPEELVAGYEKVFGAGVGAMVQSIIDGPASNVRTVYVHMGEGNEPLAALTTRKFRQYPIEFGTGSMAESYHDQYLKELGVQFFRDIGYRGFGTVEFKLDNRDGQFKLTDLNPRWVKPINLPIDSGVDFPLIHYLDVTGQKPAPQFGYREGVRWLQGINDLAAAAPMIRAGELSPIAFARAWLSARSFSVFAMDDWGPFLKESRYGLRALRAPLYLWRRRQERSENESAQQPPAVRVQKGDG